MSKPAALSQVDKAKNQGFKLVLVSFCVLLGGGLLLPELFRALVYGVILFNVNYQVFMFYAFRYTGSRSSFLMLRSISKAVFIRLLFFALALAVIYRFDERMLEPLQSASILLSYMLMQLFQFGLVALLEQRS